MGGNSGECLNSLVTGYVRSNERINTMNLAVLLIILALILGGVGLAVEALRWVLIIALVLLVWGALTGRRSRVL